MLKIKGRISVLASYTFAHQLGHLYGAIAVSDTRLNAYVVVISTTPDYPLGTRIDLETGNYTSTSFTFVGTIIFNLLGR
ncbi:MAG: hypothetical protein F6K24_19095 [Okeania sp. SIO2D1]|nr:hypothetical protein [Okeania sp. SIO2D1]